MVYKISPNSSLLKRGKHTPTPLLIKGDAGGFYTLIIEYKLLSRCVISHTASSSLEGSLSSFRHPGFPDSPAPLANLPFPESRKSGIIAFRICQRHDHSHSGAGLQLRGSSRLARDSPVIPAFLLSKTVFYLAGIFILVFKLSHCIFSQKIFDFIFGYQFKCISDYFFIKPAELCLLIHIAA